MKIFVVEDDKFYNKLIEHHLTLNPDYEVQTFFNGSDFLRCLNQDPDLVTLDFRLPDMTGHEILKKILQYNPDITVIIISGQEDISTAVSLLKEGAYDYITKDENIKERLLNIISYVGTREKLKTEITNLKSHISEKFDFTKSFIGESKAIKKIFGLIQKAIDVHNITVSITGETGTGKELVAKTIHFNSNRKDNSFVAVNMGAIPRELVESELFGHEKGAFTGAYSKKIGKFEEANLGTIFFDEVAELDFDLQVKLLRAIQEKEIVRVGGNNTIKINCRIITATNKDLLNEVQAGNFREDLYYRLLGLPIGLPPVRDRDNDILLLADYFLNQFCKENKMELLRLSNNTKNKLLKYHYPGNVRELKAIIELAAVMTNTGTIEEDHITFTPTDSGLDLFSENLSLKEYEIRIIKHFLQKHNNNVVLVAKKLNIGKSKIYNMIKNKEI